MKIAFLSRYQNTVQRGAETFVRELASELSKRHEADILIGEKSDSLAEIVRGKYQIVVSVNGRFQSFKASLGRIFSPYKLVIPGQSGVGPDVIWNLMIKPDLFVALTKSMYNWAKTWVWGSKLVRIPNGVDLNKFTPTGTRMDFDLNKPVILSVGALVWSKYHERTIKALSLLRSRSLVLVGEGPEKNKLEDMGKKMLKGRFKILQANYNDLPKIYRGADLFTLPSWDREAFGIVYLEAMASGIGVVAPNDSSRSEIIGDGGILVDVSDPKKYALAIAEALNADLKAKALKQAEKFSWEKIAKQYEQEFENLL